MRKQISMTLEQANEIMEILSDLPIRYIPIANRVRNHLNRLFSVSPDEELNNALHADEPRQLDQ